MLEFNILKAAKTGEWGAKPKLPETQCPHMELSLLFCPTVWKDSDDGVSDDGAAVHTYLRGPSSGLSPDKFA